MTNVAVVGIGQTKFGEQWRSSLRDLAVDAGCQAISDSRIDPKMIEALFVGNMAGGGFSGQEHVAALVADNLGLNPIPATRCEGACASGALSFRQAYMAIKSGHHDCVMALGVEKMNDVKGDLALTTLMGAGDAEWEGLHGLTFTGLYALMAQRHMKDFGTTREQMAMVSVNNHKNGKNNPLAQFRYDITIEQVLKSTLIADPLRVLDCSPITDGSAAVVLVSDKLAKQFELPVWVLGSAQGSDTLALHDRKSLTEMWATKEAAKRAYEQAKIVPEKIDIAEVHDCFSINEIIAIEDLGFCKKGDGGRFVEQGKITIGGERPVNTQGGLKACGHPVGATGIRQICDITRVIRGSAFNNIKGVKNGLALNVGGSGATATVNILGADI